MRIASGWSMVTPGVCGVALRTPRSEATLVSLGGDNSPDGSGPGVDAAGATLGMVNRAWLGTALLITCAISSEPAAVSPISETTSAIASAGLHPRWGVAGADGIGHPQVGGAPGETGGGAGGGAPSKGGGWGNTPPRVGGPAPPLTERHRSVMSLFCGPSAKLSDRGITSLVRSVACSS